VNSVVATGEAIAGAELSHDFAIGGEEVRKWLKVTASPVQIGGRRFAMVALDDITRRVETEQRLEVLSYIDELSGLRNRRSMFDLLAHELDTLKSRGGQVALAMLDIDNFKAYNDRFGHVVGDHAIRALGRALSASIRLADAAGRYGGEEFMLLFPGATPAEARVALLRARARLAEPGLLPPGAAFTFSGGVAGITAELAESGDANDLIHLADALLYRAKAAGKDRVLIAGE
jgi:diguanylate cyclase (GGDEF)-like protein